MISWIHYTTETVAAMFYEANHGYWPYGDPPQHGLYFSSLLLLSLIATDDTPRPDVCPTNKGGMQIEWHVHGADLELEVINSSRLSVSFERGDVEDDYDVVGGPGSWQGDERLRMYMRALEAER